ncbi:hypothetical protein HYDPIDRAFT_176869 [Hydnomerulius pinastri MD-312]|uniref:Wax synthase domain-containing protein n=1 Tax=Hydnomerulius pinastri MD-312 TaxID=994086 RepID=A0A0C9WCK8_9AGAM|nr:hypothetical protein HYDPIDRAFT_176869 [Hydnomerulius pinastri MD-312]
MSSFLTFVLPVLICQYLMGVLVQLKGTFLHRVALLPVLLWFVWRASITIDPSGGDPNQAQLNAVFIGQMCSFAMRGFVWATAQEPYRRADESISHESSQADREGKDSVGIAAALWNTWDLLVNLRGIGWNWSRGFSIPTPFFKTRSRVAFVMLSAVRLALHVLAYDATIQAIRAFSPEEFASTTGGSIFDPSLSLALQVLRCITISFLTVWMAYFAMEWGYQLQSIIFVTLFQQHPSQWPPLFNSPWLSTSLSDLWGRRWHQMLRHVLLTLGGRPFAYLFGRLGGVIGVFVISGLFHDGELRSVGRGGNSLVVIGFFTMNGVGIVLERVWKKMYGKSVGGIWGWVWTFSWLALWGVPMVDEWAKAGRFSAASLPGDFEPSLALLSFVQRYLQ